MDLFRWAKSHGGKGIEMSAANPITIHLRILSNLCWVLVGMKLSSHSIHDDRETPVHALLVIVILVVYGIVLRMKANRGLK
jgi:hypothetical protein